MILNKYKIFMAYYDENHVLTWGMNVLKAMAY